MSVPLQHPLVHPLHVSDMLLAQSEQHAKGEAEAEADEADDTDAFILASAAAAPPLSISGVISLYCLLAMSLRLILICKFLRSSARISARHVGH